MKVQIPVNVKSTRPVGAVGEPARATISDAQATVTGFQDVDDRAQHEAPVRERQEVGVTPPDRPQDTPSPAGDGGSRPPAGANEEDWRDRALRLQAEMDNFRKRQQRLAQDQIDAERQRLLRGFLRVVDDLERALDAPARNGEGLREGVQLTHRAAQQLLQREGVEPIYGQGSAFDPNWHEAVNTVDHAAAGVEPNTVVDVLEPGYRYRDQLLRPARVVVAV